MRTAAAILLLATSIRAADWISLKDADLEVISDASERAAREALDRLIRIRGFLPARESPTPLQVFLFSSASDFRATAPDSRVTGFYQTGFEHDYIATYAGAPSLPRVVMHEYVHFALYSRARPTWLEEGLAEYYSNLEFKGDSVRVGAPIPEHVSLLERAGLERAGSERERWLTPQEMEEHREDRLFYAESWALVHMLAQEPQFPERITVQMLTDLRKYIRRMRSKTVPATRTASSNVRVDHITPLNVLLLRAELAAATQHPDLAREFYAQASRIDPDSPEATAGMLFQQALLERDQAALEKAAMLNPKLGEAQLLLGERATDAGELDGAIRYLERAVELLPRKSTAWYALGFAQQKRGNTAAARMALDEALRTAKTPEQTAMAKALRDSLR